MEILETIHKHIYSQIFKQWWCKTSDKMELKQELIKLKLETKKLYIMEHRETARWKIHNIEWDKLRKKYKMQGLCHRVSRHG